MPTVESGGVPIHFEVIGEGQPIVLVHGFSSSFDRDWRRSGWVDFLVGEGLQVIGLDCRGHGSSGKPHSPESYGGNRIPDDVLAVMDAAGVERAHIMGYSMGALVTLNLLSRHAERFSTAVVGGAGLPRPAFDPQGRAALAETLEAADPATIGDLPALRFRQSVERRGNDLPALAAFQRSERTQADQAALRRLDLPLLVVVGEKDEVLPSARQLVAAVAGAELVTLAGEDHQGALAAPAYKQAVGRFLRAEQKR
ncbi:MAG TPA: alpha/beta hydrolase [Gaiellaceae bacterium]|nr:alpha/beta hydrolase [Gaiellaceae bacterium]